jgi:hypothetical protein
MLDDYGSWTIEASRSVMFTVLRLMSVGFCYKDGDPDVKDLD